MVRAGSFSSRECHRCCGPSAPEEYQSPSSFGLHCWGSAGMRWSCCLFLAKARSYRRCMHWEFGRFGQNWLQRVLSTVLYGTARVGSSLNHFTSRPYLLERHPNQSRRHSRSSHCLLCLILAVEFELAWQMRREPDFRHDFAIIKT